ncbi:uncharacterized protein LOC128546180 [Mercenaria mercenaria]|uniref:uncharacterized protein LOC128546180 n=1 Tax=Mercenaria mercenaria TaxID=6596 RepID=UPI00234E93DA|nr:uncharacterized protein LOC128546180 [Mercenaria mercenaria]
MEFKDNQCSGHVKQLIRYFTYAGSESELSIRGTSTEDVSTLSVANGGEDLESFAAASFSGDGDECVKDPCAICFSNRRKRGAYATRFCSECGLLGHFLCGECLSFHKKLTKHTDVRSLRVAAKCKERVKVNIIEKEHETGREKQDVKEVKEKSTQTEYNDIQTELENERKIARQQLTEKIKKIHHLETSLLQANIQIKNLQFKLQTEIEECLSDRDKKVLCLPETKSTLSDRDKKYVVWFSVRQRQKNVSLAGIKSILR